MTWALITSVAGSSTTSAVDTTGANLIILALAGQSFSVSDNKSNTWTALTSRSNGAGNTTGRLYYCENPTVGSGHTFSTGQTYNAVGMVAFSGADTSPFDQQNTNTNGTGTPLTTGSVTPGVNGELLIAGLALGGTTLTPAIDSSYTLQGSVNATPGVTYGVGVAYLVQTTAAASNPSWSWAGGSTNCVAEIATFKVAAASGVTGTSATTNANDTSASSGTTTVIGTSATTNANDASASSGTTTVTGASATTNADDTSAASGSVGSGVTGTSATTNADDSSAASGTTTVTGTSATTNADDTSSATGWAGIVSGTSATINNNDTSTAFGVVTSADQPTGGGVPWNAHRKTGETEEEKRARRIAQGIITAAQKPDANIVTLAKKARSVLPILEQDLQRLERGAQEQDKRQRLTAQNDATATRQMMRKLRETEQQAEELDIIFLVAALVSEI